MAPIAPFLSEAIYQNLVVNATPGAPESVHHTPFPQANAAMIDETLSARVAACIRLVSLGRSARKEANLKVRQPLAEMVVVPANDLEREAVELFGEHFLEELNVKTVSLRDSADGKYTVRVEPNMKTVGPKFGRNVSAAREQIVTLDGRAVQSAFDRGESFPVVIDGSTTLLTREDVSVRFVFAEGFAGAVDGKTVVLLDSKITPELRNEGLARDIVRNVQNLRKDAGLDLADRIVLSLTTGSRAMQEAIAQCASYIAKETLAAKVVAEPLEHAVGKIDVEIDGPENAITISLCKA